MNEQLDSIILRNDDEAGRLAALNSYDLHPTDASSALFQDLVELAQTLVGSKMAFISLVEKDRQWFKSAIGLDVTETPRDIAFCDHAIRHDAVMVVLDAKADPRFADNPLVTGPPFIRFYAGAPIIDSNGYALGTICLSDPEPRKSFTATNSLAALARHAAAILELRRKLLHQKRAANLANDQRDRLWDNSLDMMLISRADGQIIAGNPAWERTFGPIGADGKNSIVDYFDPDEDQTPTDMEPGQNNVLIDRQMRDRNGDLIYASWNLARDGDLIFGIARDLTQARATEMQLAHAQRMESIGQLTGGIAHDFNNLLTIILGNLDIAQRRIMAAYAEPSISQSTSNALKRAEQSIGNARDGAQRAANLTQRLLAFARRQSLSPKTIQPDVLIRDLEPLARQALDERIGFEVILPDSVAAVEIDPSQLENAILNLIVNARDSISGQADGQVGVRLSETKLSETRAQKMGNDAKAGSFVKICVSDNGTGIAPEIASKIFEPFFTTKDIGRGTGLGLSQVQGFVVQSGGFVTLETEIGTGTTVSLWLPAAQDQRRADSDKTMPIGANMAAAHSVDGLVLLVEDNVDLRNHIAALLEEQGLRVAQAADGIEARDYLDGAGTKPNIILSDITMPRMDGHALALYAATHYPDIPIVLMTGYAGGDMPSNSPHIALITKPFSSDEIINLVMRNLPTMKKGTQP